MVIAIKQAFQIINNKTMSNNKTKFKSPISRRSFISGTATACVGTIAMPLFSNCSGQVARKESIEELANTNQLLTVMFSFVGEDLQVCGTIAAARNGAKVILI